MTQITIDLAADSDDGNAGVEKATYPVDSGGTFSVDPTGLDVKMHVGRNLVGGNYGVYNGFVRFDTSVIPDAATVTAATLKLYVDGKIDTDGLAMVGDYYDYGGSPPTLADWSAGQASDAFSQAISGISTSAVFNFTLSNLSSISKTGYTGIRIKCSQRAADAAPTNFNFVEFGTREHASEDAPQLVVDYAEAEATYKGAQRQGLSSVV